MSAKKTALWLWIAAAVFAVLLAGRFVHELSRPAYAGPQQFPNAFAQQASNADLTGSVRRNYASEKIVVKQPSVGPQVVDQKYEQVAELDARSKNFDADARRIKVIAAEAKALVQQENATGLPGSRYLMLSLGVVPESFDSTVEALRGVAELESIVVTKTDKTADYKALEAKRLSLEKTRDGLRALRTTGAALADLVALETKILEIEGQIQELGVSLGDFSETNSFCTINVSISESRAGATGGKILGAFMDALGWAVLVELGLAAILLGASASAALAAFAVSKLREGAARKGGAAQ